jgi:hypothetical protein
VCFCYDIRRYNYGLETNPRQRERERERTKKWRRVVLEVTELTTKKYGVFMEKIIVDKLLATSFGLS